MKSLNQNPAPELKTDVAIIGGGIAGSITAVLLQNIGVDFVLIDPHEEMPKNFQCEKFNRDQMAFLEGLGISKNIYEACTPIEDIWIARQGKLVNKMNYPHYGFSYETPINAVRDYLDRSAHFVLGKVKSLQQHAQHTTLTLTDKRTIDARLVVVANGLNPKLRTQLGISQKMLSETHEMAIGFDIEPTNGNAFGFESFTFWPEKASEKLAYFTAFKSGDSFRVNTFGYWEKDHVFMKAIQTNPDQALAQLMPSLNGIIGDFRVSNRVHVRPVDLYQNEPSECGGIVFIGDAYSTSCPAAGTGTSKAMVDAQRLAKVYIPKWLAGKAIKATDISEFYADEAKLKSDADSFHEAFFLRSLTLEKNIIWGARRWMRFFYHLGKGAMGGMPRIFKTITKNKAA